MATQDGASSTEGNEKTAEYGDQFVSARLTFQDEVLLKAESPMVVWFTHAWPDMAQHLAQPLLEGGPTGGGSAVEPPPTPPAARYVALCDVQHASGLPGRLDDGTWFGGVFECAGTPAASSRAMRMRLGTWHSSSDTICSQSTA